MDIDEVENPIEYASKQYFNEEITWNLSNLVEITFEIYR